jgi:hypothetical protein
MASTRLLKTKTGRTRSTPKGDLREQLLAELRGGDKGVRRWNARPLKERKAVGGDGLDLSGAALAGVDLASLPLAGARFDRARLTKAWLLEADLGRASFREADLGEAWCAGADLRGADFSGASLAHANLRGCDCRKASFQNCSLDEANLSGGNLCGVDLSSANLHGAVFTEASYDEGTRWPFSFRPPAGLLWAGRGRVPVGLAGFVRCLEPYVDARRLGRALEMLKAERFQLYSRVEADGLAGVVKSQTEPTKVYSCRLGADGRFACCDQALSACQGMREALCKHLLVLLIGLARTGEVDPAVAERWVQASRQRKPKVEGEVMSETLLRYQAAQAGDLDWGPTETVPADYYAL